MFNCANCDFVSFADQQPAYCPKCSSKEFKNDSCATQFNFPDDNTEEQEEWFYHLKNNLAEFIKTFADMCEKDPFLIGSVLLLLFYPEITEEYCSSTLKKRDYSNRSLLNYKLEPFKQMGLLQCHRFKKDLKED